MLGVLQGLGWKEQEKGSEEQWGLILCATLPAVIKRLYFEGGGSHCRFRSVEVTGTCALAESLI